jgi:dTDP-4-dehydrorhamnose reductase
MQSQNEKKTKNKNLPRILVTGGYGMIGSYIDFGIKLGRSELDVTNFDSSLKKIKKIKPEIIIHLAAITDVDLCEKSPDLAYKVNTVGTYNIALISKNLGIKLVYISTTGVFDGLKKTAYTHNDSPNPMNVYGHSKLLGELAVKGLLSDYIIARTCWMMGGGPTKDKKFVAKIISQINAGNKELKALSDAFGSPTYGKDLVEALIKLIHNKQSGTFHIVNSGSPSRYDVASFIANHISNDIQVQSVNSAYFKLPAKRVRNESAIPSIRMRDWKAALKDYLESEWTELESVDECRSIKKCRICGSQNIETILDLGNMPPANAFIDPNKIKTEKNYPLSLKFCKNCSLAQLGQVVNPKILFSDYHYITSASEPLIRHFASEAEMIVKDYIKDRNELVVEFGSNDGTLLSSIKNNCRVLGVDPAKNIADLASSKGVETHVGMFNEKTATQIKQKWGSAKVIIANNVFAHIHNINDVMRGVKTLLTDDGVFISESHWVYDLLKSSEFDQIYHEHLSYYSLHALKYLAEKHGLKIIKVEQVPIHGVSLRIYMSLKGKIHHSVNKTLKIELDSGINKINAFKKFASRVHLNKTKFLKFIKELKKDKKIIAAYGAPGKGNTLLNFYGLNKKTIKFITDSTPLKQGTLAPGSKIPIVHPDYLLTHKPDYLVLLSWNYADAILKKEEGLRNKGVKFILPIPNLRII